MSMDLVKAKELKEWFKSGEERNYPYWIARKKQETKDLKEKVEHEHLIGTGNHVECCTEKDCIDKKIIKICEEILKP